ncbi:MAG: SAVED domain-containing protein [Rhodanobacter sp.]
MLHAQRGKKVGRNDLYAALSDGNPLVDIPRSLRLDFVRGRIETMPNHLGLDVEDGGRHMGTGAVPYAANLQRALENTAVWARGQGYRRVGVDAPLRLSVAFGLGAAFRAPSGFELEYGTAGGSWPTDAHPPGSNAAEWTIATAEGPVDGRLTVVVGVIRDPLEDVCQHAGPGAVILHLHLPRAVVSGTDVQASVRAVKDAVSAAVTRLKPAGIDLFFLGPAVLAAALGHRWNALPPTTFFEHDRAGGYLPTIVVR